jgi:hypothetical protein
VAAIDKTIEFYKEDFNRTLFPLNTNLVLIENGAEELSRHIYQTIKGGDAAFHVQTRAHSLKKDHHLRRTFKLDPVAEFFIYDMVYRNRAGFKQRAHAKHKAFGYYFSEGRVPSPSTSFRSFRNNVLEANRQYKYCAKFDIASYFNSIYHHDLVSWFRGEAQNHDDVALFDKYLKQINAGRSIDCLPQGILPAKILGSHYLSFIDNNTRFSSELIVRFMDDFYVYSNDLDILLADFYRIQKILGEKGLSLNSGKTEVGDIKHLDIEEEIDDIKQQLLEERSHLIGASGEEPFFEEDYEFEEPEALSDEQVDYLIDMLSNDIDEEDAELVLAVMRDHTEDVLDHIPGIMDQFPNLSKNIYHFCRSVPDKAVLTDIAMNFVDSNETISEYQLFWLAKLAEDDLSGTLKYGELLTKIFEHTSVTPVVRAKVLEIPENRFSMPELREEQLRTGTSDWASWAAAIGTRSEDKATRNHLLGYFANGGPLNQLISNCVKSL